MMNNNKIIDSTPKSLDQKQDPVSTTKKTEKAFRRAQAKAARLAAIVGQPQKRDWYFTFMVMNLPIVGWFYLLRLAFRSGNTQRRTFAKAYLLYKLTFTLIAWVILGIGIYIGMGLLDQLLAYMQML